MRRVVSSVLIAGASPAGRARSARPRRRSARRGTRRGRRSAAGRCRRWRGCGRARRRARAASPTRAPRAAAGSCEIGKNVPEKRKSGTSPKRKIAASHSSPSTLDVIAASDGAEREPAEQRRERREHGERARRTRRRSPRRPRRSSRRRSPARRTRRGSPPRARRRGSGVETAAWYVRSHLRPALTGNVVTLAAVCIAVVASSAGATNCR